MTQLLGNSFGQEGSTWNFGGACAETFSLAISADIPNPREKAINTTARLDRTRKVCIRMHLSSQRYCRYVDSEGGQSIGLQHRGCQRIGKSTRIGKPYHQN